MKYDNQAPVETTLALYSEIKMNSVPTLRNLSNQTLFQNMTVPKKKRSPLGRVGHFGTSSDEISTTRIPTRNTPLLPQGKHKTDEKSGEKSGENTINKHRDSTTCGCHCTIS